MQNGLNAQKKKQANVPILEVEVDPYAPQAKVLCNDIFIPNVLVDGDIAINIIIIFTMNML